MNLTNGSTLKSEEYTVDGPFYTTDCCNVFSAHVSADGTKVRLHILLDSLTDKAAEFIAKASALSAVQSPSFYNIADIINEDGVVGYVTPDIDGPNLEVLCTNKPQPSSKAESMFRQLTEAVGHVHALGQVILGISPGTVTVSKDGTPVITDFSLLEAERKISNPYNAPELSSASSSPLPENDIYSLGALLYLMLVGKQPPMPQSIEASGIDYPDDIPYALADIIDRSMEPRPRNRYYSTQNILADLGTSTQPQPVAEPEPEVVPEPEPVAVPEPEIEPTLEPEPEPAPEQIIEKPEAKSAGKRGVIAVVGIVVIGIVCGLIYFFLPGNDREEVEVIEAPVIADHRNPLEVTDEPIVVNGNKFQYTGSVNDRGLPNGHGRAVYQSGLWAEYDGEFVNGQRDGKGKLTYRNGDWFEGQFSNDMFSEGTYHIAPDTNGPSDYFTGTFTNGTPCNGAWYHPDGSVYQKVVNGN